MVQGPDPDLVFANFGDIDRYGHSDPTGPYEVDALRTAALAQADLQIGRFLAHLRQAGKWASSIVFVLADHSMDWSVPVGAITLSAVFASGPAAGGNGRHRAERRRRGLDLDRTGGDESGWRRANADPRASTARCPERPRAR
jgi:hypothetical protein